MNGPTLRVTLDRMVGRSISVALVLVASLVVLAGCDSSPSTTARRINGNKAICGAMLARNKWSSGANYPSPTASKHQDQVFEAACDHQNQLLGATPGCGYTP